jgi:hypothetical protein
MLFIYAGVRQRRLRRILLDYPLYDPPHKAEERTLSEKAALENFEYFMSTRLDRAANFTGWLRENFGVRFSMDLVGVRAACRWGNKFAGLLPVGSPSDITMSAPFFKYQPIWRQEYAGYNVIFDMGTTYGEALLAQRPTLCWAFSPSVDLLTENARAYQKEFLSGYRRPQLIDRHNPAVQISAHEEIWNFCFDMRAAIVDKNGQWRLRLNLSAADRRAIMNSMVCTYRNIVDDHIATGSRIL